MVAKDREVGHVGEGVFEEIRDDFRCVDVVVLRLVPHIVRRVVTGQESKVGRRVAVLKLHAVGFRVEEDVSANRQKLRCKERDGAWL